MRRSSQAGEHVSERASGLLATGWPGARDLHLALGLSGHLALPAELTDAAKWSCEFSSANQVNSPINQFCATGESFNFAATSLRASEICRLLQLAPAERMRQRLSRSASSSAISSPLEIVIIRRAISELEASR